jgi:hypothetical protein
MLARPVRMLRIPQMTILQDEGCGNAMEEAMRRNIESIITTPMLIYSGCWLLIVLAFRVFTK